MEADIPRLEYAGLSIAVSDIDEASIQMQETLLIGDGEGGPKLQRIAADYVLGSLATGTQDSSTILSLYDTILHNWVAPLPEDIPVQVRQHKERLARRVGAEIILATTRVRYQEEQPQPVLESQHFPSQDSGVAFPESSSQPIFSQPASSYLNTFNPPGTLNPPDTSSQLLPSIPETLPPSRFCSQPVSDPLSRLRKHLRIEKPLPERLPPSIAQVLTHWQPGANPNTYNWEEIEGAIQDSLAVDNESTQQKRDKARRKKERKDMRQRREDELFQHRTGSQPQMFRSSPGPTLERGVGMEMSSQVPVVQSQSQSQPFGGMVVQSQREPGKHGGRPEAKKKKKGKGRISGF
jgi:RNA polymerase I-specific transcription initiation factor RRN6